jgi:hypothetical protein
VKAKDGKLRDEVIDYQPMDRSGLFRTFANVDPTKKGVLKFANKYGWLGINQTVEFDAVDGSSVKYEKLSSWVNDITLMRLMVDLWDSLDNREYLWEHIEWKGYDSVYFNPDENAPLPDTFSLAYDGLIASEEFTVGFDELFTPGDVLKPAHYYLMRTINKQLYDEVMVSMRVDLQLCMLPKNLLGTLWLQFAQAVSGKKMDYQQCIYCGEYFEKAPGVGRKDKKYCSNACRVAAARKRREEASREAP